MPKGVGLGRFGRLRERPTNMGTSVGFCSAQQIKILIFQGLDRHSWRITAPTGGLRRTDKVAPEHLQRKRLLTPTMFQRVPLRAISALAVVKCALSLGTVREDFLQQVMASETASGASDH
jgi:hypothetical protein